ncbi:Vanillyl-alcohol oxidase protein [Rutstroemia sp. NJR-2017a BVV2]|nr:Vanillyl-alcohol oxidase protein [Rutstroemia sp. NJR-2017a BVV2]
MGMTAEEHQNGDETGEVNASTYPKSAAIKVPNRSKSDSQATFPGDPMILPPGISSSDFNVFISRCIEALGYENVQIIEAKDELVDGTYQEPCHGHDMHAVLEKDYFVCSSVVCPKGFEEVQEVMKIANEADLPVWPYSIGRNSGYGGAAPRVPGSVGINLGKHMNKILEVNTDDAYALVEPGVTFMDLHKYLEENNLREKVWLNVPDSGGGSIIGNAAERGLGYTPHGDHWMTHCGLEVVLPNGDLIHTGMGALPNPSTSEESSAPSHDQPSNRAWQPSNHGFGPHNDGIFTQSSLGIIVKMGIQLMPNPGGFQPYMITLPRDGDLATAIDIMRSLRAQMILQSVPTLRHILLDAAIQGPKSSYSDSSEPLTSEDLDRIAEKLNLGRWNFYGALYGPETIRNAHWLVIKDAFSKIPGAKFYFPEDRKEENSVLHTRAKTLQGIPSLDELKWMDFLPDGAHIFFSPVCKISGKDATAQYELAKSRCLEAGLDFLDKFVVGMRDMHHIVCIVFDKNSKESKKKALWAIRTLIQEFKERGWGVYRTHLACMDQVAETYDWNDGALMKFNEQMKNGLDPNGILAPGKNGIWPQNYDREKWRIGAEKEVEEEEE